MLDCPLTAIDVDTDATSEKRTRGQLKAAVERSLRGERVVILDAPNNIKGYRHGDFEPLPLRAACLCH